jgi:hypothetical protein
MTRPGASRSSLLLARLAAVAAGLGGGQVAAIADELDQLPERAIEAALEDSEADADATERAQLLALLAIDARADIRFDVARSLAHAPLTTAAGEALVAQLAVDPDGRVRRMAAADLLAQLRATPALHRPELLDRWASDPLRERRLALARALASDPAATGSMLAARTTLALLADDTSHDVRAIASAAMSALGERQPL